MKTINELQKMIGGVINSDFDFSIDKNRRYTTLFLTEAPTVEQVRIANQGGYKLVAQIMNNVNGQEVIYQAIPVNGQYEFEKNN